MHKILSSDFLCCKILLFISRLFIFVFCQRCHATAPLTPRGRYPGARRDLRSPGGEAGAGAEIGAETGGGRETGDTGGTRQRAATQVGISDNSDLIKTPLTVIIADSSYDRSKRRRDREKERLPEVERLAEIERKKTAGDRQKEIENRQVEIETNRRIEELVAKRVEEELEKRKDEIEREVLRRVEEAKKIMEETMMKELEVRKQEQLEEAKKREVFILSFYLIGA